MMVVGQEAFRVTVDVSSCQAGEHRSSKAGLPSTTRPLSPSALSLPISSFSCLPTMVGSSTQLLACAAVLFCSGASAAIVAIDWNGNMTTTATAMRGDMLSFAWSGTKPVVQVATKAEFDACDGAFAIIKTGTRSPSLVNVSTNTPDGTVLYFINSRADAGVTKCESVGMKVAVTIAGGAGGDAGQCVAVACRVTGPPTNALALSANCCDFAADTGYEASCAEGFTYYQWGQASSEGQWSGGVCRSPQTGTCCVATTGGSPPAGATLPGTGSTTAPGGNSASGRSAAPAMTAAFLAAAAVAMAVPQ